MNPEKEINEQQESNLRSRIKEFRVPWKEFLNWNLLFLIPWIFSLLYILGVYPWIPEKVEGGPGIMNFGDFFSFTANPLEWTVFNFIMVWALLFAVIMLIEDRERFIPAWIFVLISFAIGMYGMMPYFAIRSVWRKQPKTKKSTFTKVVDSKILGIILHVLGTVLLLYGIIAASLAVDGWSGFLDSFLNVRLIQLTVVDFALFTLFYPILIWDDMKRRNWKNVGLFILFSVPIVGALVYVIARPRLPEGKIIPSV